MSLDVLLTTIESKQALSILLRNFNSKQPKLQALGSKLLQFVEKLVLLEI